jgi:phospho-N-acetylmuramoyl-pentapeptide-transferase
MLSDFLFSLSDQFGALNVFRYITFRASLSFIFALLLCLWVGPKFIKYLQGRQIGEAIRDDGPESHFSKKGTPTMGGLIILFSVAVSALLWGKWSSIYFLLGFISLIWMGFVGFIDDYIKVIKKDKRGLAGRFKIVGQVLLGLLVGLTMLYHEDFSEIQRLAISIPFFKNVTFEFLNTTLYVLFVIFVITATSNGVNLTDGLDGLAAGSSAIVLLGFAGIAYVSGHVKLSDYLNIMYLPGAGELTVLAVAIAGAVLGFLWYNSYPAQIFMGDTGSLALGSMIATSAILVKKEIWLVIIGGIFVLEALSVIIQTSYFKYTKRKFGEGRRVFLMAPIHHHFEKKGLTEPKIVIRFWIIGILLLLVTFTTFKTQ